MAANNLTAARVRELLDYDPATGVFTWLINSVGGGRRKAGAVAGGVSGPGYVMIGIDGKKHLAHRLAWLHVTGEWPKNGLDHRNTIRADNRFDNLREASPQQNSHNVHIPGGNSRSGVRGVSWCSDRDKWKATIVVDKRQRFLGHFDNVAEAAAARRQAKVAFHPFGVHGAAPDGSIARM